MGKARPTDEEMKYMWEKREQRMHMVQPKEEPQTETRQLYQVGRDEMAVMPGGAHNNAI